MIFNDICLREIRYDQLRDLSVNVLVCENKATYLSFFKNGENMSLKHFTFKNKKFYYGDSTEYKIQCGKDLKSSYKTKYTIVGDLSQAIFFFDTLTLDSVYKKRLLIDKKILFRAKK